MNGLELGVIVLLFIVGVVLAFVGVAMTQFAKLANLQSPTFKKIAYFMIFSGVLIVVYIFAFQVSLS